MHREGDQYRKLADVYDLLAGDVALQEFYREWRKLLLRTIAERKLAVHTLVDLACGTGNSTIPWTRRRGWIVIGVDASPAMLREARRKSDRVRWYCQDIRKLRLKERAEVVTCHFDALNHILAPQALRQVFAHVAGILNEGGLFQFDISTEHWFRWLDGREKLFPMGKAYLMTSNKYDANSKIGVFRHLWFIPRGHLYEKRDLAVRERPYSIAEIRATAKAVGLRVLRVKVQRKLEGKSVRLIYLLEKTEKPNLFSKEVNKPVRSL